MCINKANKHLGLLKRLLGYTCNFNIKLLGYTALVRPLLEFSSVVWSCINKKDILLIEGLQRKATKFLLNNFDIDYKTRLTSLNLLPLSYRRDYLDIIFLYYNMLDLVDSNLFNYLNFRPNS